MARYCEDQLESLTEPWAKQVRDNLCGEEKNDEMM